VDASLESGCCAVASRVEKNHLNAPKWEQIFELLAGMHTLPLGLFVNSAKMLFYGLRGKQGTRFGDLMSAWHLVASPFEHAHLRLLSIPKWYYPPPLNTYGGSFSNATMKPRL
jgi:hypothetical protein